MIKKAEYTTKKTTGKTTKASIIEELKPKTRPELISAIVQLGKRVDVMQDSLRKASNLFSMEKDFTVEELSSLLDAFAFMHMATDLLQKEYEEMFARNVREGKNPITRAKLTLAV